MKALSGIEAALVPLREVAGNLNDCPVDVDAVARARAPLPFAAPDRLRDEHDQRVTELLAANSREVERRREARRKALEDAASVADSFFCGGCGMDGKVSAAIRALAGVDPL